MALTAQDMHDFVRKYGVTMTATRTDRNPHMDDAGSRDMDHWRCKLRYSGAAASGYPSSSSCTIIFSMGSGHHGAEPTAADVLNAMASDCSSVRNSNGWEDFASDMGMPLDEPADRRKAKRAYAACEKECEKLIQLFGEPGVVEELMYQTEGL